MSRFFLLGSKKQFLRASIAAMAAPVIVTVPSNQLGAPQHTNADLALDRLQQDAVEGEPVHHRKGGLYVNPWKSFTDHKYTLSNFYNAWSDWNSKPHTERAGLRPLFEQVPPPEKLPEVITPTWGKSPDFTTEEEGAWSADIKATWLGHACFLVEWPAPSGAPPGTRGPRILFDPVWSNRCSPSQWVGPARVTPPPFPLEDMPHVDAVVISHNHYDHLDVATIKHIYRTQPQGSVHFFAPLKNAQWFRSAIGTRAEDVTELEWWDERLLTVELGGTKTELNVVCTPCQHFTGRGLHDRNHSLWASWAVTSPTGKGSVWFAGDTGYRTVPRGVTLEDELSGTLELPHCPAFKQIGQRFGAFDLAMIPIGAYSPRWIMSRVHASPEDAVEIHRDVNSRCSMPMHHSTWVLTDEEMTEPMQRLQAAREARGIPESEFRGSYKIGETLRRTPHQEQKQ